MRTIWIRRAWLGVWLSATAWCAEPSVEFDVQPRAAAVGETVTAILTVRELPNPPVPDLPVPEGFQLMGMQPQQTVNIVNGALQQAVSFRFLLRAEREGRYTIGPFRYKIGSKSFDLPGVQVDIVAASGAATPTAAHAIARLRISKPTVYVHEQFQLAVDLLYRGVELDRQVELAGLPESGLKLDGFMELPARREVVDGQVYEVRVFQSTARALASGEITLEPILRVRAIVGRRGRRGGDPWSELFENFFRDTPWDQTERRVVELRAAPVVLTVRPLPAEGRPESFSGAVGACTWDVDVHPTEVTVGEPITITMVIRGDANLDVVQPPKLDLGPGFRTYDIRSVPPGGSSAPARERVFEQVVIPRDETVREIPALSFSYFDPEQGVYRTLTRGPFPLVVRPATNTASVVVRSTGTSQGMVVTEGVELRHLKATPSQFRRATPRTSGLGRHWVHVVPVLAAGLVGLWARRRDRRLHDPVWARRLRAAKRAQNILQQLERSLKRGEVGPFYERLWKGWTEYFSDRFNLAEGEADPSHILAAMGPNVDDHVRQQLEELYRACLDVRFAGAQPSPEQMSAQLDAFRSLVRWCEQRRVR